MKVGDLVRFKSDRDDWHYEEFHGHVGLVVGVEESVIRGTGDCRSHPVVRWLEPVLYYNKLSAVSHFDANKYEVIQ